LIYLTLLNNSPTQSYVQSLEILEQIEMDMEINK